VCAAVFGGAGGEEAGALFSDGSGVRHFAVVTNREGEGLELLRWHREKAGPWNTLTTC